MRRHIVLVGLPGAGKSAVGLLAAQLLSAEFVDGDVAVEAQTGRSVAHIFEQDGEQVFRSLEAAVVTQALQGPAAIVAPGGGWATQPGALEQVADSLSIHLAVEPEVAAGRLAGRSPRPLLRGDPLGQLRELATTRLPYYTRADRTVRTTDRTAPEVAAEVVRLARSEGGW